MRAFAPAAFGIMQVPCLAHSCWINCADGVEHSIPLITAGGTRSVVVQYCGQSLPTPSGHRPCSVKPNRLPLPHWKRAEGVNPPLRQNCGPQVIASV